MDQITDNIWISSIQSVRQESMSDKGISTVITVCQDDVRDNIGCDYHYFNMADGEIDFYGGSCDYTIFKDAADQLYRLITNNETVLIHCHKGQSRSPSVAIAAIGKAECISYDSAKKLVQDKRPMIEPNEHLEKHARKYIGYQSEQTIY